MIQELNRRLNPVKMRDSPNRSVDGSVTKSLVSSPPRQKKDEESNNDSPSKAKYLPSRYGANDLLQSSVQLSKSTLLNELQQQMAVVDDEISKMPPEKITNRLKEIRNLHPVKPRGVKITELKNKPIKKSEMDFLMFKEIFVEPKEKVLHELKEKEKTFANLIHKGAAVQYDKILGVHKDEEKINIRSPEPKNTLKKNKLYASTPHLPQTDLAKSLQTNGSNTKLLQTIQSDQSKVASTTKINTQNEEVREIVEKTDTTKKSPTLDERAFFEQQIQVQPPETPNYNAASPLTPGNGWAPSIPLIRKLDPSKSNIKDLLVRAKAGMQVGDIQKEAHLTFYLGMVHETKKEFKSAIKSYRRFLACAQNMEDKIGVALAMNRIGVNYFNIGKFQKSIEFHQKNLELSDRENSFAAYYNLGISNRSLANFDESLKYFRMALDWSKEFKDIESECLSLGQLGITFLDMGQYEMSMENFKDCYDLSVRLNNAKLQLDCLLNMSKISKILSSVDPQQSDQTWNIYKHAYNTAKGLGEHRLANMCLCNMGVLEGTKRFDNFSKNFDFNISE